MRQIVRISVLLAIILLSIHTTESYVRIQNGAGLPIAWNLTNPSTPIVSNGRVTYRLDSAGSDDIPFPQVEASITASFRSWENIPTSTIAFQRGPNFTSDKNDLDGAFDIFWTENSTIVDGGADISGALAVSFIRSSTQTGEIIDLFIVFNGNEVTWATNGRPGAFDVQQVATHEIGHCIGLDHSPNAAATMFPRTGDGQVAARTLSTDDQIAVSVIYPTPDFSSSTGSISGHVLDTSGTAIFGAHVVAVDANGVVITSALSQSDGSYSIPGLPPGDYNVYAQPLGSDNNIFFNRGAISSFYSNTNIDFQTTQDFPITINPGAASPLEIAVVRGIPAFEGYYIADQERGVFSNLGTSLVRGKTSLIGVLGPGIPQGGMPLTISGPGITFSDIRFGSTTDGLRLVLATAIVDPTAPLGPRNIIISDGTQRTILTGGVEVFSSDPRGPIVTSISSQADYSTRFAPGSLAAAFGLNLAGVTMNANSNPLPTAVAGASITITDSSGISRQAPLMYLSPIQINFQLPTDTQVGPATIIFTNSIGRTFTTTIDIQSVAPAILTRDASGVGLPTGYLIRFRADGTSVREDIARFDQASGINVPIPIDMGLASDRILLVLFGTGFRNRTQLPAVTIGGMDCQVVYAGRQGDPPFANDQINIFLNKNIVGGGPVDVLMTVDGMQANPVTVTVASLIKPTVSSVVSQANYSTLVSPESLSTVFGTNLAGTAAGANSNPLPTTLAGASISITDSSGTSRQAALMYASSTQINFQIPAGTALGSASFTFTNPLGYTVTATTEIQPAAPAVFSRDATGMGLPIGYIIRFRADGTSAREEIARFDEAMGTFVPIPINLGSTTDRILLVLFGTGFRRQTVSVKVGEVDCQVVYAGPQGDSPFVLDQLNVFLSPDIPRGGPANVVMAIGTIAANPVTVSIQ
jgi:uncharacterized protein (TIGR03437 family)